MTTIRVFYAQAVDFVPPARIRKEVERLRDLVCGLSIEIVAPYIEEEHLGTIPDLDRKLAQEIVDRDYSVLDSCSVFLADMSRDDRQAVGMVFEMSYAQSKGKIIVIYTGESTIGHRIWIIATANHICETWGDVRQCLMTYTN